MKAIWKDKVIAESDETERVEGNHYFPRGAVNEEYLKVSDKQYTCPWKGDAEYYHLQVDGAKMENAAWSYREPREQARHLKEYVAFEPGVEVKE